MNTELILYPAFAMFALTMSCIFFLGLSRFLAIRRQEVRISYFRTYNEGSQPERLHLLGRHIQNHFEVPPLFYIAVLFTYVTDSVTASSLVLAWLFVATRVVHSMIHLGGNNVSRRFFTFGFSLLCLTALWANLFYSLLTVST